ncbi:MAG: hypothetical protein NTY36_15110 [Deltaproteobacteria bacterium]|nr:hypothetical protein [Deltaproteobacteria bacterium]
MIETNLKPVCRQFNGSYVGLDLEILKINLVNIIASQHKYFTDPLDTITWESTIKDGIINGEKEIKDLITIFDLYDGNTVRFIIKISHKKETVNRFFRLLPDEYIIIVLDFLEKTFFLEGCVIGESNSFDLFNAVTSGIKLITFKLPAENHYLEKFLHRFFEDPPVYERNVFLIMRFRHEKPFIDIVDSIRNECAKFNLNVLRADDKEYTDDLWDNVLTYIYGCKSAIAVFDQINYREFNPNVALEVGFLFSQCKRVLLFKDMSIPVMPSDIVGKIYRSFNTYAPYETIPPQIEKWVIDYKIGE